MLTPIVLLTLSSIVSAPAPAARQGGGLPGTWHGTSSCVDKTHNPACNDEVVIYEARAHGARGDLATVSADRITDGVRVAMGDLEFARQADGSWVAEFRNARTHTRIVLRIMGNHIAGTMNDVATGRQQRVITLDRSR